MTEQNSSPKPKRTIIIRRHHSEEIWAQARRDYLAGYTASAVSKHYGMSVDAIRKRASKQKWCKAHHMAKDAPAPLGVSRSGGSAENRGFAISNPVDRDRPSGAAA